MNKPSKEPYKGLQNIIKNLDKQNEELLDNLDNDSVKKEEPSKNIDEQEKKTEITDNEEIDTTPGNYPHIDEMQDSDLRNWEIRSMIKDQTSNFRQECSMAIKKKDQNTIHKIVEILKKALILRHYDDTNSEYFTSACNDIFNEIKKHTWRDYYDERDTETKEKRKLYIEKNYPEIFKAMTLRPDEPLYTYLINRKPYDDIEEAILIVSAMIK